MSKDNQRRRDGADNTAPEAEAAFQPDAAFLDDWSVVEDIAEFEFASALSGRTPTEETVQADTGRSMLDLDDVVDVASSVILELLEDEYQEASEAQLEHETIDELQRALRVDPPPSRQAPPRRNDTQEIEILEEDEVDDPFSATGIQIVDVDTGEIIPTVEADLEDEEAPAAGRNLALKLEGVSAAIDLPRPWGAYLAELREEIVAETDMQTRAGAIFIFGQLVRSLAAVTGSQRPDVDVAQIAGTLTRSDLLERLAARWARPDDKFFELLHRLERLDEAEERSIAATRRSAIAGERLLDAGLTDDARARLQELVVPPETLAGLIVKAVDAHVAGERGVAVAAWERLASVAKGEMSTAAVTLVGFLLQGTRGLLDVGNRLVEAGWNSRPLLLMMQRDAVKFGDRLQEARVLKRLVGLDVHLGKRLPDEAVARTRLKGETAERLHRLSAILEGMPAAEIADSEVHGMDSYDVLVDAISLSAKNPLFLRRLEALARRRGDVAMQERALISLATVVREPHVRAVVWERLADLTRRTNAAPEVVLEHLERSLQSAPDCLPAVIAMGQHLIATGAHERMLAMRAGSGADESREMNAAWRRAELLERTHGDPVETLSLYRDARDEHPGSVHLFFCVERALARLADWRGLRTLYDSGAASDSPLRESLRTTKFDLASYRLAVEVFLEEDDEQLPDAMVRFIDRPGVAGARDDTDELRVDQNILWRVIAGEVGTDPGRALGRLEVLLQTSRGKSVEWRLRALVWYAHVVENVMGEPERALPAYREVFDRAEGRFLRRWAVRGLLRTGDASWVAEHLARSAGPSWVERDDDAASFRQRMAAELMGISADATKALDILEEVETTDPVALAELAERATVLAIRSRQWVRAIPWFFRCYPEHLRPALAEIARHLGAAFDDAEAALRYIDTVQTRTPIDPYVILCELELAYRARDWDRALDLIEDGLGTIAAGSIDFRAFLLEQAVLVAEWGSPSNERALTFLEDLWSLDPTVGSSPIFGAAAFLRTYSRMRRDKEFQENVAEIRQSFTPSVAEALLGEVDVCTVARNGAEAGEWYERRMDAVPTPLAPYYRWMAAVLRWMFGERDRASVQTLADTVSSGDPTHRVGPFLLAIAYRHADMYASCERQLAALRTPGHSRPVQDWVLVRQLFHTAVTQNQPREALDLLREQASFGQFAWYGVAEELFARALQDPSVVPALEERAKTSVGARNLRLEIAEITQNHAALVELAEDELPEAVGQAELMAARGERVSLPRWDVQTRRDEVRRSLDKEPVEKARGKVLAYFIDADEEIYGTPWCPIQLIRSDLSGFGFSREDLDALRDRFTRHSVSGMGSEARLLLARQLLRIGRRDDAYALMPDASDGQLVGIAWSLFNLALNPFNKTHKTTQWVFDLWERRRMMCRTALDAEISYEVGRYLELIGRPDEAIEAMRRALSSSPRFLPAQVAAGRLLITAQDWEGLGAMWEIEMQHTEDAQALASVAFRLGYLWERRLGHLSDARQQATDAYRRVLRVRPDHFPSLHALVGLAYDAQDWAAATDYLAAIAASCPEPVLRASYLCELAGIRETHLEDLSGACAAYRAAFEFDPESVDALAGVMRTDTGNRSVVEVIRGRLRHGVTPRELRDLCHHLFAATATEAAAGDLMTDAMPTHYAWLWSRLLLAAERGHFDRVAADKLLESYSDDATRVLVDAFRRRVAPRDSRGPANLLEIAKGLGTAPQAEGQLVSCMHYARQNADVEALGTLAAVRARRASSEVLRATELTWVAVTLMLRNEWEDALEIAEQLLEQVPNFVPAVKTAKFAADHVHDWESVVRWFEADAVLSRSPEIAARDRLYASEVQRRHLGDYDAALAQLRTVLEDEPLHAEAFAKLRDILMTRRAFGELLQAYEKRVTHTEDADARSELLNQMGEIALNHEQDRRGAIRYFARSVELRPRQLRRLRQLSELYELEERWDQAVVCHRASAELLDDPAVLARLWQHIGKLYETRLNDARKAKDAFARALKLDSESTDVLIALARVCEHLGDFADATALLQKVVTLSRDPQVLLDARVGVGRLQKRVGAPPERVLAAIRDVLLHHPGHLPSIDAARKEFVRTGVPGEAEDYFQELTHAIITQHGPRALPAAYEMAKNLGHTDRAFCIASIARELGAATPPMQANLREAAAQRRWPVRPLPPELTGAVLPPGLVAPFVELLRRSRDAVTEGLDGTPAQGFIKRGTRLKEPRNKATQLAFLWPALLGLELRDVHTYQGVPGMCDVHFDNGVRLILDEKWLEAKDPTELTVALGLRLAAYSMGIGPWALLDTDAQQSLFVAIVSNFVKGWAHAERAHLPKAIVYPRIQRWLERKGQKVAPYALEISGRFGAAAIRQQFELLNEAQRRLAVLMIDDPGRALRTMGFLRNPDAGERPAWLFMLGAPAARIRRAVGVAIPE